MLKWDAISSQTVGVFLYYVKVTPSYRLWCDGLPRAVHRQMLSNAVRDQFGEVSKEGIWYLREGGCVLISEITVCK